MKKIYIYRLIDARGEVSFTVVDNPSDNIRLGGYDINNQYQQYDSYEAYYACDWAKKHGMELSSTVVEIDTNALKF